MQIRWTVPAAQDLYKIISYIRRDDPGTARIVAKRIYDSCSSLTNSLIVDESVKKRTLANWCLHPCRTSLCTA